MAKVYSVTQINGYIRQMFEHDFFLHSVQVVGEVSNVKYHSSGHIYFTLKDEGSVLPAVMFRSYRANGLPFTLQNGQSVVVSGNISVYERDGRYQLYAVQIAPDGRGNLYEAFEQLKKKLYEEGLFEFDHKKDIPKYPKKVGIVTARTGAAIQDILNIAKRRNPYVQLYLYPAKVQGDGASQTIARGIRTLDRMGMDTIIVGRGGGSIEDLWPFNEEIVARAIYDAVTPIISGNGHEIDNTIADYVADLRAPTPSAACELAIPDVMTTVRQCEQYERALVDRMHRRFAQTVQYADQIGERLSRLAPQRKVREQQASLQGYGERMSFAMHRRLQDAMRQYERYGKRIPNAFAGKYEKRTHDYELALARLNGLSPTAKLSGGYGYVADIGNRPVRSTEAVRPGDEISVTMHDGIIYAKVTETERHNQDLQ